MELIPYLARGGPHPVDCLTIGKEAAARFRAGEGSLNEVITKLAKAHGMNDEQVRRTVEIANNSAFEAAFGESGDKNITFDVAEPEKIASALKKKTPELEKKAAAACPYSGAKEKLVSKLKRMKAKKAQMEVKPGSQPPPKRQPQPPSTPPPPAKNLPIEVKPPKGKAPYIRDKMASVAPQTKMSMTVPLGSRGLDQDALMEELFGPAGQMEKSAAAHVPFEQPKQPLVHLMQKTADVGAHLEARMAEKESLLRGAMENFVKHASQAILTDNISFPDITYALASGVCADAGFIKKAMAVVENRVESLMGKTHTRPGLYKRGSGAVVNESHPLIVSAKEAYKLACAYGVLKGKKDALLDIAKETNRRIAQR